MPEPQSATLQAYFVELTDPRMDRGKLHLLSSEDYRVPSTRSASGSKSIPQRPTRAIGGYSHFVRRIRPFGVDG
jgi:hypothetical protein